jgi:hypothetical protein
MTPLKMKSRIEESTAGIVATIPAKMSAQPETRNKLKKRKHIMTPFRSFVKNSKINESPVGQIGRTGKNDAVAHIEGSALEKEFQKIVKQLGGKTVARELLQRMNANSEPVSQEGDRTLAEALPLSKFASKLEKDIKDKKATLKDIEKAFRDRKITSDEFQELEALEFRINEKKIENPASYLRDLGYKLRSEEPSRKGMEIEFFKSKDAELAKKELESVGFGKKFSFSIVADKFLEYIEL